MLIVLDRDGVINFESDAYVKSPDEWIPIPGSIEAICALSKAGFRIVIATNQAGINRGLFTQHTLDHIHQKMLNMVRQFGGHIERIYFCPHHPDENCDCRKPKPGMLKKIHQDFKTDYSEMIFIGDSLRDLEAANAVGCQFILVKTGNGAEAIKKINNADQLIFDDLLHVANYLISR